MITNTTIGAKYYKIFSNEVVIRRLYKVKNDNAFILVDEDFNKITIDRKEFLTWSKLLPHGYINCSIVDMRGIKDVMVTLALTRDLQESARYIPFAVCRQQLGDLFVNNLYSTNYKLGLSANRNNCPKGITMDDLMICTGLDYSITVAVYVDDIKNFDRLLKFIPSAKFDVTLYTLKNSTPITCTGSVTSLKDLLISNDFIHDFCEAFDILILNYQLNETNDLDTVMYLDMMNIFKNVIDSSMSKYTIIKYGDDIDIDSLPDEYRIILDKNNELFIVAYSI